MRELETTQDIDAPAETVWSMLIDFPSHADWNPFFASIEGTPAVGERLKVVARKPDGGSGMRFSPTVLEVRENELLIWKGRLLVPGIFDGTHSFRLEALENDRTRLHHSERFQGLLVPLLGKLLADTERGFESFNRALAERAEARSVAND